MELFVGLRGAATEKWGSVPPSALPTTTFHVDARGIGVAQVEGLPDMFDTVVVEETLQCVPDPMELLDVLWAKLKPGGVLVVAASDDGLKLTHPHSNDLQRLLDASERLAGAGDRGCGRKIYGMLRSVNPAPVDVSMHVDTRVLAGKDRPDRIRFFDQVYGWLGAHISELDTQSGMGLLGALSREQQRFADTDNLFSMSCRIVGAAVRNPN